MKGKEGKVGWNAVFWWRWRIGRWCMGGGKVKPFLLAMLGHKFPECGSPPTDKIILHAQTIFRPDVRQYYIRVIKIMEVTKDTNYYSW